MALDMSKFLARFVEEAREHIEKLNKGLVFLEQNPDDAETINAIFRSAHTIKGSSRMMKLTSITDVAHKVEDVLGALRDKKISHSKELADLIFRGIDVISEMIDKTASNQEINIDASSLCDELAKAAEGNLKDIEIQRHGATVTVKDTEQSNIKTQPETKIGTIQKAKIKAAETMRVNAEKLDELIRLMGEIVSNQNRLKQRLTDIREIEKTAKENMELVQEIVQKDFSGNGSTGQIAGNAQSLSLMLREFSSAVRDDNNIYELLIAELQEKALLMRMVPLSTIFDSMHRMVRDISTSMGKQIDLIIEGGDIELDRKIIDKLGDPLIHILRNSIDHGIESPEERLGAGKAQNGAIRLSASYDAGSVLIEISDDGRGIQIQKIKEKALRKKIFSESEIDKLSESALTDLIYHPGFSTSAIITDVSGRGVGLDVVKRNIIEDLKGSVKTETKEGKGTTFSLRLPMTLAVMRILLVSVSDRIFGIAANYVSEILNVHTEDIITVVDKKAIRLREEFIPLVSFGAVLGINENGSGKKNRLLAIIVRVGSEKLGLIIDSLLDEEDMVIKSLPSHMNKIQMVSGVTISGKGEIVNLLHIPAIIEAAKEMHEAKQLQEEAKEKSRSISILLVDDSINTRDIERSILEAYGYQVAIAGDGIEAFEKAKEFKYDIIITDLEMPRLDGFSLTQKLRGDKGYKNTPIIIVTSREKEEDKRRGIAVGADAYIVKGAFDQSTLLETIQNLVG